MRKRSIFNAIPALAAIAAIAALLASCGEGEPENINIEDLNTARNSLEDAIKGCNGGKSNCPELPLSSNSPSSSPSSSPSGGGNSSSSIDNTGTGGNSSSSKQQVYVPKEPPPNAYPMPTFSCYWEPDVGVISGDEAFLKYSKVTGADNDGDCTVKDAVITRTNPISGFEYKAYFPPDEPIVTAGLYKKFDPWPNGTPAADKSWPLQDPSFKVWGVVHCAGRSYDPWDWEKECAPLNIKKAPSPDSTGITFTCSGLASKSIGTPASGKAGNLALGTTVSKADCTVPSYTISNNPDAKCGALDVEIEGDATAAGAGRVKAKVVTTCRESKYTLKTLTYDVVNDPSLSACTWTPTPNKFYKGQEANAKATLSNSYGRCGADGEKNDPGYPRLLDVSDVGKTLSATVSVNCTNYKDATLTSPCPASPEVGDGKFGGSPDLPYQLPGDGSLPGSDVLGDLDGVIYISGQSKNNQNRIRCSNTSSVASIKYCSFGGTSDCTVTDSCSNYGDCPFPQSYFRNESDTGPWDNTCNNKTPGTCVIKIKIEIKLNSGTNYPSCSLSG